MNHWLCKLCLDLPDGEGLEHHIQAHAYTSPWSHSEIRQAVHELRATAQHCDDCRTRILFDVVTLPLEGRRSKTMAEAWEELQRSLAAAFAEVAKVAEPLAKLMDKRLGPPPSVKERALQAQKNRNTGPARPSGPTAKRPRRH